MSVVEKTASSLNRARFADLRVKRKSRIESDRKARRVLAGVGALGGAALCVFGYWYFFIKGTVYSDDARFNGHMADLGPEIYGTVDKIFVREGNYVKAGEDIFSLDDKVQAAALVQAETALVSAKANVEIAQAQYDKAINGNRPEEIKEGEAALRRLEKEEEFASAEHERYRKMLGGGAVSRRDFEDKATVFETARRNRENAELNLSLLQQGPRKEEIAQAKANLALAQAKVAEAQASIEHSASELKQCHIKAPFDGWIVRRWLDPGATPLIGQPVVTVFDPSTLRVDANIEERFLNRISIGDEVDIKVDAYPGLKLKGRIYDILRATNAQFSVIPAEGVSGTFIKVAQRVPLRISVVDAPPEASLGPGMSVEITARCGTSPLAAAAKGKSKPEARGVSAASSLREPSGT